MHDLLASYDQNLKAYAKKDRLIEKQLLPYKHLKVGGYNEQDTLNTAKTQTVAGVLLQSEP